MTLHDAEPVIGYRWFRVHPGGELRGAQNVTWPDDRPLQAAHVRPPLLGRPSEEPLLAVLWRAATRRERSIPVVVAAILAGLIGWAAPASVLMEIPFVIAATQAVQGRRTFLGGLLGGLMAYAVTLAAATVALVVVAITVGNAHQRLQVLPAVGIEAVAGAALIGIWRNLAHKNDKHTCPAPPRRLFANAMPECGIHAYRTLDQAAVGARFERFLPEPVVLAQVSMGGTVYEYTQGWRASHARIDGIYDTGDGHAELPAARYRVPLRPSLHATRPATPPRLVRLDRRMRHWANQRSRR